MTGRPHDPDANFAPIEGNKTVKAAEIPKNGQPGALNGSAERIPFAEDTLALQFADAHEDKLRYIAKLGRWQAWNGSVWLPDDTLAVFDRVREMVRVEAELANKGSNKGTAGKKLLDAKVIASVERLARSDRRLAATIDQWDADPWRLNTPGSVIDLRTGTSRDAEALDYLTKCTAVSPRGPLHLWPAFIDRITGGDTELASFIQRMAGYVLTGVTIEHALFFLYGTGANGKSVLLNTVAGILGDYATAAPVELFLASKTEQHPTGIASLMGARLVTVVETEKGRRWAESRIKGLTGGDKISARFMRQDYFEFQPQFKLLIAGNHKPGLRGVDEAMRRRMNLLPFTTTIPAEDRDPDLTEKLKPEWPGILQWMIDGCLDWQRSGLAAPPAVVSATEQYMETEDSFGQWVNECCDEDRSEFTLIATLFDNWKLWAEKSGEFIGSQKSFSQNLEDRGYKPKRQGGSGKRGFTGICIRRTELDL